MSSYLNMIVLSAMMTLQFIVSDIVDKAFDVSRQ